MKNFKFILAAFVAISLFACQNKIELDEHECGIGHSIRINTDQTPADTIITFAAVCGEKMKPFIWWIDGNMAYIENQYINGNLVPVNGHDYSLYSYAIVLHGAKKDEKYVATLHCYDEQHKDYYVTDTIMVK